MALDVLEHYRKDFAPGLFANVEKWSAVADDLEVAEVLGTRIAAPALAARAREAERREEVGAAAQRRQAPSRRARRDRSRDRRPPRGRRRAEARGAPPPRGQSAMVSAVARLLRETTRVDAKAVQDFLFRRSIDGNPDILRAGSENLDAARRAALIAKLEAQAALTAPVARGREIDSSPFSVSLPGTAASRGPRTRASGRGPTRRFPASTSGRARSSSAGRSPRRTRGRTRGSAGARRATPTSAPPAMRPDEKSVPSLSLGSSGTRP